MNTPIYDALLAEQNAASDKFALAKYVADGLGVPLITEKWIITPPENVGSLLVVQNISYERPLTWRTFLRCLFWWLP